MMREKAKASDALFRSAFLRYSADIFLFLSFAHTSLLVVNDYLKGGDAWHQGDWLINNAAGLIRRGPFGSAIISIADAVDLTPLLVVSAIQIALLAGLFIVFRLIVREIRDPKISLPLVASPAIFTMFWVADPQGSLRKELIAFVGIALYALGAIRVNRALLWSGVVVFCIGTFSHEAMVLFAPTFIAIVFVSGLSKISAAQSWATIAAILGFSTFAFLFAITHRGTQDIAPICTALTDRGLGESICTGAIKWLSYDSEYGFKTVVSNLDVRSLTGFLIAYLAALAPFAYLIWLSERRVAGGMILILSALPFAPLYLVAVDWGRWISFHVFSVTIVLACGIIKNRLPIRRSPGDYQLWALLALAILISPLHTIGIVWGGAARRVGSVFWSLLS